MSRATVIKLKTDDGLMEFKPSEGLAVGQVYEADLATLCIVDCVNIERRIPHRKEMVLCRRNPDDEWGYIPTELLQIES